MVRAKRASHCSVDSQQVLRFITIGAIVIFCAANLISSGDIYASVGGATAHTAGILFGVCMYVSMCVSVCLSVGFFVAR